MTVVTVGSAPAPIPPENLDDLFDDPRPYAVGTMVGPLSQQVLSGPCRFCGAFLIESAGAAAAVVEIYDGYDNTAQLAYLANIPISGSTPLSISHEGVEFREGVFLNVLNGTVRGGLWLRVRNPA